MKLFGINISRTATIAPKAVNILAEKVESDSLISTDEIENYIREANKKAYDIDKNIDELVGTNYKITTITDWVNAMRSADQPWREGYNSNWVLLHDIFLNMVEDPHVRACINTLKERVQGKDYYIADKDGNKLDEATDKFHSMWFYDFAEAIVNVRLWGFSLIQMSEFTGDDLTIREINRKMVHPEMGGVVEYEYATKAFRWWDKKPYKTSTIFQFDSKLGELNTCVRWWVYKTEIARIWAKYNQLMGIPPIIAKTKLKDTVRKDNLVRMLKNWMKTRWVAIDMDDEIVPMPKSGTDSQQFFENLMRYADEQISKALLGSTMVLDNGSSKSQSEVHESNTATIIASICRHVKLVADKKLIPRLRDIGFQIPEGARLIWDNSEKLTMKERAEIVTMLAVYYDIEDKVASEFIGMAITAKAPELAQNTKIKEAVENYKKLLQHGKN